MSIYYLDTSALVKRYFPEIGSSWIQTLTDPHAGHVALICELTRVEAAAAFAAKHRAPHGITRQERDKAVDLLLKHCSTEYQMVRLTERVITRAISLTQGYRLRAYDALQLAAALAADEQCLTSGLPRLTFITSDMDLLTAALTEGLPADDPRNHA